MVSAGNGLFTLLGFLGLYLVIGMLYLFLLLRLIHTGPAQHNLSHTRPT